MVSEKQHAARIAMMKSCQCISYEEANELNPYELWEYFNENCKSMAMQYSEEYFLQIVSKVAYSVVNGFEREPEPLTPEAKRNFTWARNHKRILNYYTEALRSERAAPTVSQIAGKLGLSRPTVTSHLKQLSEGERQDCFGGEVELLREDLLVELYDTAKFEDGATKVSAAKAFLQATRQQKAAPSVNLIQVNNIYVTTEQLAALSPAKQKAIAAIITADGDEVIQLPAYLL